MKNYLAGLAVLVVVSGCPYHPLDRDREDGERDPLVTSAVMVETQSAFDRTYGNGVIVHSTREQGTLVLTTAKSMSGENPRGVVHGYTRETPEGAGRKAYRLDVLARDPRRDLALARLDTREIFKTVRFHPEEIPAHFAERRLDVRMAFLPHDHPPRVVNVRVNPDGRRHVEDLSAVSGGPVFCEGRLIGVYSDEGAARIVTTREVREFLQDFGYGFIISVD